MRVIIKRVPPAFATISVLFALALIFCTATAGFSSIFSYEHSPTDTPASASENTATNNVDSEEENSWDPSTDSAAKDEQTNLYTDIPGVGASFGHLLDSLINLTRDSENRFQSLANHFPLVFADLYKVFITL